MTGMAFRIVRDGKVQNVDIEHLTEEERAALLASFDHDAMLRVVEFLCRHARMLEVIATEMGWEITFSEV